MDRHSSLNSVEIKSTYDYIINYINTYEVSEFNIPLLQFSNEGKIHFVEVKNIFMKLNLILFISTLFSILSIFFINKYKESSFLNWSSNMLLCTCLFISILFSINFDKSFNIFHKMFFKNNYWLFDPIKDPVINILPQEYFFHCTILIISLIIFFSILLKIMHKFNSKYIKK